MSATAEVNGTQPHASPPNRLAHVGTIVAGAVAISGVGGYWIVATLQCGLQTASVQSQACPLTSVPVLIFLSFLTLASGILAATSIGKADRRLASIASAILVAGAIGFPIGSTFTYSAIPYGTPDPRTVVTLLVISAGLTGFVASAWRRWSDRRSVGPYNRLALGAALIGFVGLEAFWFPGVYPGQAYPSIAAPTTLVPSTISPPGLPKVAVFILIVAAFGVAVPIFIRSLMPLSVGCSLAVLGVCLFVLSQIGSSGNDSLAISTVWIAVGALVALIGSIPGMWKIYVLPRYGSWWQTG